MKPNGGTELLYTNLLKYTSGWQDRINLIPSTCDFSLLNDRVNVLWQHLSYDQRAMGLMADPTFVNAIDYYVYVSNWQLNQYQQRFDIANTNHRVIRNAIEPIEYKEKPNGKIQLIYTSMPFRGLDVLLEAFTLLNRDDVELVVYSSNIIYGRGYSIGVGNAFDFLFHRCRMTPGVIYKGYGTNKAVRSALQSAHILAYPSTFEETSCLCAIEAGAAGCKIVTTDLGALSETTGTWATLVPFSRDRRELVENYTYALNREIDQVYTQRQEQSTWFNEQYSWQHRAKEWNGFFQCI